MLGKTKTNPNIDQAIAKSINFELTIADIARRSERRAWYVAIAAISMALVLAGGYFFMLPLKEKVPYLVMADAYTGTSTVARMNEDGVYKHLTTSEAINRSNVAHFVLAREAYDVTMMNLHDWPTVLTMAAPDVAAAYQALHASTNDNSPYKLYGRNKAIRVTLLSTVLMGGNGQPYRGATVRFQRSLYDKQTGVTQPLDNKIATLSFTYKPNLKMAEKYRVENPLGFQVTSYRIDNDYATAPPPPVLSTATQADSLSLTANNTNLPTNSDASPTSNQSMDANTSQNSLAPPVMEHEIPAHLAPATSYRPQGRGNP